MSGCYPLLLLENLSGDGRKNGKTRGVHLFEKKVFKMAWLGAKMAERVQSPT